MSSTSTYLEPMDSGWDHVDDDCLLCEMEKKTIWYYEDDELLIANTLHGAPFVVWKDHTEKIGQTELQTVQHRVSAEFGEHSLQVEMSLVPDHWHAHVVEPGAYPEYLRHE